MSLLAIAFYLMAAVTLASAVGVVSARNPVHSVLWLILSFFSAAGLFVLLGAEFLAMLLVVVYVGAVAVLFLFVVMMLDVDFAALSFAACMGGMGSGNNAGVATYDDLKLATQACAAKGGELKLKRNGDPQYLEDYACEKAK